MAKPTRDAERLDTVQRAARYVLSRSIIGQTRFTAMDIYPVDLSAPKSGSTEYAWRQQLAWVWAKAGYLHQAFTGTGLQRRRIYTVLQAGRDALERIASDPVLASFYIPNKRTSADAETRPPEFFQPPELVRVAGSSKNLRLVPSRIDPISTVAVTNASDLLKTHGFALPEEEAPKADEAREPREHENALQETLDELRGLPVFFERITSVLEHMNERLVKVETAARDQSALLIQAAKMAPADGQDAPVTRDEVATALAEMTQAFLRDNPQNAVLMASLKKHDDFHVQLGREMAGLHVQLENIGKRDASMLTKSRGLDAEGALERITKATENTLRAAVVEEVSRTLSKEIPKVVPAVRKAVSEEFGPDLTLVMQAALGTEGKIGVASREISAHADALALSNKKNFEQALKEMFDASAKKIDARLVLFETNVSGVVDGRVAAHAAAITKKIDERFEALTSNVEKRLSALAPDVGAVRKLSEKLEKEISGTCEELKESLASISADAEDLAERVESVVENFDAGHQEFKRQGVVVVENFKHVSMAAEIVLEGAHAVAKEMIALSRLRAAKDGVSAEEIAAGTNAALTRVAEAGDKIAGTVSALGGGLIKPVSGPMYPIITSKNQKKEES